MLSALVQLSRLLPLVSALALTGACGGRTVVINGREVPYERAERDAFGDAKEAFDAGRFDDAAGLFERFLAAFPESQSCDEARLRRGQALSRAGRLEPARKALEALLVDYPASPSKGPAAVELQLVQQRLQQASPGAKVPASPSLRPLVAQLSEQQQKEQAQQLSEAFAQGGEHGEAARFAARAVESAPPGAERDARLKELEQKLAKASPAEVAQLAATIDQKSPAWPPAALRLSRLQLHTGDRLHALELAQQVAQAGAGPSSEGAQELVLAIQGTASVKPNLIGVVLPQTGNFKAFADGVLDAIALRLDLLGKQTIQVSVKDSKNDPEAAAKAVEELAREGAIAIIGPIGLAEAPAAAVRAQQLGVPLISLSRAEGLTGFGSYIFRDMLTSSAQARAVADYAQKKLGAKTFGVLQPDSPYGDEMTRHFWDALDAGGSEVRAYERYPVSTTTFKPFVSKMVGRYNLSERAEYLEEEKKIVAEITDPYRRRKALSQLRGSQSPLIEFDALFLPDNARMVRLIAPSIAAEDVITSGCDEKDLAVIRKTTKKDDLRTVQLLGTSLWDSPELLDERMGAARYVQCSIFADSFFAASQRPATRKFVEEYEAAYHRVPDFLAAHGHDAAGILKDLVEKKHPQTREEMRALLASMPKAFEGAAGDVRFGPDREAQKQLFWLWINRGNFVEFDPEGTPPVPPVQPAGAAPAPAKGPSGR
jgi:branched-chain amino acid transport system substrate-binding protein